MIAVPIGSMRRVVVASPALIAATRQIERPEELVEMPCVVHHGSAPAGKWNFGIPDSQSEDVYQIPASSRFASNQAPAVVDACVAGLGFGCFLSYQVEPEVRDGRLEVLLEAYEPPPLPVQIIYPDARLMSPRLRRFVDWMKAGLKTRPEIKPTSRLRETREQR